MLAIFRRWIIGRLNCKAERCGKVYIAKSGLSPSSMTRWMPDDLGDRGKGWNEEIQLDYISGRRRRLSCDSCQFNRQDCAWLQGSTGAEDWSPDCSYTYYWLDWRIRHDLAVGRHITSWFSVKAFGVYRRRIHNRWTFHPSVHLLMYGWHNHFLNSLGGLTDMSILTVESLKILDIYSQFEHF